jgi:peptide chain release factor
VNKTSNCVFLKHLPSGVVVKCHETRSQAENRRTARLIMLEKLDILYNGLASGPMRAAQRVRRNKHRRYRRSQQKLRKLVESSSSASPQLKDRM